MSEELIFGQTQIHRSILEALRGATEYVIWFSMLSQFKDPELEHTLNNLLSKNVKLYIFHGENPYLHDILDFVHTIPSRIQLNGMYVNHMRYLSTETIALFGGVDFNKNFSKHYEQHCIRVPNCQKVSNFNKTILELTSPAEINHTLKTLHPEFPIICNLHDSSSAFDYLKHSFENATETIMLENQYIQHKGLVRTIVNSCLEHDIELVILYNAEFETHNPYHPGKEVPILTSITNHYLISETQSTLDLIRQSGIKYEFLGYRDSYTHNKIFAIDDTFIIGTFNFHTRSLTEGNDVEIGYVSKSKQLIDNYKKHIMEGKRNDQFKRETKSESINTCWNCM
jgi:phosphatidylserine/phosphatidylglycerophosphate/cardiolipin synthase-like enzyme